MGCDVWWQLQRGESCMFGGGGYVDIICKVVLVSLADFC